MQISRSNLYRASFYLTAASIVTIVISITASQTFLALALATLLASREKLRLPRVWLPLSFFLAGTLLSLIFSPEPAHGFPDVKKMFVYSTLLVVFSTIRYVEIAIRLFLSWVAIGAAVACYGVVQFSRNLYLAHLQHQPLYEFFLYNRFTGFMSHPMTFAGQELIVLLLLLAFLLFAPGMRGRVLWMAGTAAALLGAALLVNGTRTVWLGAGVAGAWLLWRWKRWMAVAAPVALLLLIWLVPGPIHDRFRSIFRPNKDLDSNEFRVICIRTGIRMIEAHPLLGIGLDETKYHFLDYLPPDTPQPRPRGFYQHLHNFYLQFAAERGIPTMMMLMWALLLILYDFYHALQKLPPERSNQRFLLHGCFAAVIGIMVSGLFEVNLGDSEVLTVFLAVVAWGYLAAGNQRVRPAISDIRGSRRNK